MSKTWEQMTEIERLSATWWDMYKDVHGIRPRGTDTSQWTIEDFNREIAVLGDIMEAQLEEERAVEKQAIEKFENDVTNAILSGAGNRETALLWLMRDSGANGDWELFCYKRGLPFGYFNQTRSVG